MYDQLSVQSQVHNWSKDSTTNYVSVVTIVTWGPFLWDNEGFAFKQNTAFFTLIFQAGPHFTKDEKSQDPTFKFGNLFNIVSGP